MSFRGLSGLVPDKSGRSETPNGYIVLQIRDFFKGNTVKISNKIRGAPKIFDFCARI